MKLEKFKRHRLNRLYVTYNALVFNVCMKYIRDPSLAQDLTQDIFIKVYNNMHTFKNHSKYSTWIFRISVNYCLDYIRNTKRRHTLLEQPKNILWDLENTTMDETFNRAIARYELSRYPKTTQKVLYMRYILGMTQVQIASKLGISRVAVTKRLQNFQRKRQTNHPKFPPDSGISG